MQGAVASAGRCPGNEERDKEGCEPDGNGEEKRFDGSVS